MWKTGKSPGLLAPLPPSAAVLFWERAYIAGALPSERFIRARTSIYS
ncbi:hypothetical protein NIASO_10980 [Niabella soli DSM 19437]|uniref:Uncharacterized protein n=1 Tax=Niabella soli DSM 19437 TaxID=929713 RepID=W0F709_9BACT|nr:hypothetical protein NIASO_10980 [Niabella soli DSM 19437]